MTKVNSGFTLIELIIVLAILVVVGTIFSSSFLSFLRGFRKSDITAEVKQNGDYIISVMGPVIRNSRPMPVCTSSPTLDSVTVTNPDQSQTTFSCVDVGGIKRVTMGSPGNETTNATLTNANVKVESCSFTCLPETPPNPAGVKIVISLAENIAGITPGAAEVSRQRFETTFFQRNY